MCISNLVFYAQSTIAVISGRYMCVLVTWHFMPSQPLRLYQGDICVCVKTVHPKNRRGRKKSKYVIYKMLSNPSNIHTCTHTSINALS